MEPGEEPGKAAQLEEIDERARRVLDHEAESMAPGSEGESDERLERSEIDDAGRSRVTDEVRPGPGRDRQVHMLAASDHADRVGGLGGAR